MTKQAFKFNPNHVFVDTNVLVGGYSGDARYQKDAFGEASHARHARMKETDIVKP